MRALDQVDGLPRHVAALAEGIMTAVAELAAPAAMGSMPRLLGLPVRRGRFNLGRCRGFLPADGPVTVVAGFGTVCWLGGPQDAAPDLGRLVCRSVTGVDRRGRVVLDRRVRAWLGVPDTALFEAVVMPADSGALVVPVDDFARRFEGVVS